MNKFIRFMLSLLLCLTIPAYATYDDPVKSAVENFNRAPTFKKAMLELHQVHPTLLGDEVLAAIPEQLPNQIRLKYDAGKFEITAPGKKLTVKADPSRQAFMVNDQVVNIENRSAQQIFERVLEITKGERHAFNFSFFPEAQAQALIGFPVVAYEQAKECINNRADEIAGKIGVCAASVLVTNIAFVAFIIGDFVTIGLVGVTATVMAAKGGYGWLMENIPKSCRAHFEDLKDMKPNPNGYSLAGLSCHPSKLLLARKVGGKVETKTIDPKSSGLACDEHNCFRYRTGDRALLSVEADGKEITQMTSNEADLAQFVKMRTEWDLISAAVRAHQKAGFCDCLKSAAKKSVVPVQTVESTH